MKKEKGINPFHEIIKMLFLIECEKERQEKSKYSNNHNSEFNIIIQSSDIKL